LSYGFYKELRKVLADNQKNYLYETNVGAGLPLITLIKLLHFREKTLQDKFSGTQVIYSNSL
jgi:aspartokinase/homoserine dehydrogenase 1